MRWEKNIIINLAAHEWRAKRTTAKPRFVRSPPKPVKGIRIWYGENKSTAYNTLA